MWGTRRINFDHGLDWPAMATAIVIAYHIVLVSGMPEVDGEKGEYCFSYTTHRDKMDTILEKMFSYVFGQWKLSVLIKILLSFVSKGPIDNISALA